MRAIERGNRQGEHLEFLVPPDPADRASCQANILIEELREELRRKPVPEPEPDTPWGPLKNKKAGSAVVSKMKSQQALGSDHEAGAQSARLP